MEQEELKSGELTKKEIVESNTVKTPSDKVSFLLLYVAIYIFL